MNNYTELWNYTLGGSTLPYAINNGSPFTSGGFCYFPVNSFVNKDFAGYYTFQGFNYVGHYALKFTLDTLDAGEGSIFTILCYGGSTPAVPAIQRTATGIALGWTRYNVGFLTSSGNGSTATGDFNGMTIDEEGVYTVVHLKKIFGTNNDIAMHVITPSGAHYYTGWSNVADGVQHIQIGNNTSGSGLWAIGTLNVSESLTEGEADLIRTTGNIIEPCATPTFSPGAGSFDFSVDVTLTCATPSSTIYYTTDGSAPTTSSSVYSTPLNLTANTTVRAFATAAGLTDSSVATASYVVIADPTCAKPVINVSSSGDPRDVTITCATSGASIYYTTDGSNPTAASALYTGTFQVAESQMVKAFATKALYKRSPYVAWSNTLRFGNSVILGAEYLTVIMPDGKEWLAENFAWDGAGQWWNNGASDDGDGRYYDVPEVSSLNAMLSSGWRVGTHADWISMAEISRDYPNFVCLSSCVPARWQNSNLCTNANGFSALPTGNYNGNTTQWQSSFKNSYGWWWKHIDVDLGNGTGYRNVTISTYANSVPAFEPSDLYSTYPNVTSQNTRHTVRLVREKCVNPEISRLSGDYEASSIDVKITCPDENAKFFYTTNGTDPTESSTPYVEPITINSSSTLKVIASNGVPSDVVSATYVLNASISRMRELVVPWSNADDQWVTRGQVAFNAGNLSADATNGHASWLPAYGTPTQMDVTNINDASTIASFITCYEYDVELAVNSTLVFGLNENKSYLSMGERTFEFYRESDASVRFVVRRGNLVGFDGTLTVGSRFKLRLAHNGYSLNYNSNYSSFVSSTAPVRIAVVAQDGTVVADSNWQTCGWFVPGYIQDSPLYRHPYHGSQAFVLKRGQATLRPFRVVSTCNQTQCADFITTGVLPAVAAPAVPQIDVTKLHDELNRVIISPLSALDSLIITVDEGYFVNEPYDLVRNKRAILLAPGELFVQVVSGQCVFRAISASRQFGAPGYNETERRNYAHISAIAVLEVGDSAVAVPEIAPRRDELAAGFATPVNVYCADVDATIRYTTDGSLPTAASPIWSGTMQVRDPMWLRVKTFKGGSESPAQNGLYTYKEEPMQLLPSLDDATLWTGTNASFSAGGITVNDPAGDGVVMRSDIAIDTSHLDVSCVRFRVSGPFRMKIPGVNGLHLAWVGDKIGLVTNVDEEPSTDFAAQSYADVRVAFSSYIAVYHASIPAILQYAHIDIVGSSVTVAVPITRPMIKAANKIGFTSEGVSSFTISNLEIIRFGSGTYELQSYNTWRALLSSATYPLPRSAVPAFTMYPNNDVTGQPIQAVNSTSIKVVNESYTENMIPSSASFSSPSVRIPAGYGAGYVIAFATNLESNKLPRVAHHIFNGSRPFECDIATWDREQSWSNHYVVSAGYGFQSIELVEQPTQLTNERYRSARRWSTTKLVNPVEMSGNAWFTWTAFSLHNEAYTEEHRPEYDIVVGFDTPLGVDMPVLSSRALKGIDASRIASTMSSMFEVAKVMRLCDLATYETAPGAKVVTTAENHDNNFAIWRCGRKIVAGVLHVRIAAWHDWQLEPFYDSGWINCGVSATQPKPRIIVRARSIDGSWFPFRFANYFYGYENLQESELETLFDYGTLSAPSAPVLTAGSTLNSNGTIDVTVSAPGSDRVLVFVGDQDPQVRVDSSDYSGINKNYYRRRAWYSASSGNGNSSQDDDFFTTDGSTVQVPALSRLRAVALASPHSRVVPMPSNNSNTLSWYARRSALSADLVLKRPPSDLISVSTAEPRTAVIRCTPPVNMFTLEYSSDDWSIAMAHSYKLVFDNGFEYELQAWTYSGYERVNDIVLQLEPGQHWVKIMRYKTTAAFGSYALGESDKLLFTVNENLALQTATPSSVVAGATAAFSAAGGGSSFTWFFSDGTEATGAIVNKAFEKPGRYTWRVVADDGKEQAQSSGSFIVTFTTSTLPENMTPTEELRVS